MSERAFLDAAELGKLAEVQEHLRNGVNVHAKNTYGTALHRAADKGHMEVVTALLAAGADIHLQNKVRNCWLRRVRVRGRVRGRGVICMQICMGVCEHRIFFLCLRARTSNKVCVCVRVRARTHAAYPYI